MSLVSEALRKARREAAAREAARHSGIVPAGLVEPPPRRSLAPRLALLAALVAAAVGGALAAWLVLGRSAQPPAPASEVRSPRPTLPVQKGPAPSPNAPAPEAGLPGPPPASGLPSAVAAEAHRPAVPVSGAPMPELPAPAPLEETPPPPPSPPSSPAVEHRTFVLDADLGRAKLHLDFIVFKPSAPFAGINSVQVVPGSIVAGFVVEEIAPDFVRLRDSRGTITLKVR